MKLSREGMRVFERERQKESACVCERERDEGERAKRGGEK